MNDKQKALLLKIKELAEKGVGGEKTNAEIKLKELMNKFNISLEDLSSDDKKFYRFIIKKGNRYLRSLLLQLSPRDSLFYEKSNSIFLKLTSSEAIELQAKYEFYSNAYLKDLEIFYHAFLSKNDLYVICEPGEEIKLTPEEIDVRLNATVMAQGLKRHNYHIQIQNSSESN